jgi:hypothetical protein
VPSGAALEALKSPPVAGFTVSRTLVGPDGPTSHTLEVARSGERNIVFRLLRHERAEPLFEWCEVTKPQLRALVAAVLMDERELKAATAEAATAEAPPAMFCSNCGAETRAGQRFCRACGQRLTEGAT